MIQMNLNEDKDKDIIIESQILEKHDSRMIMIGINIKIIRVIP